MSVRHITAEKNKPLLPIPISGEQRVVVARAVELGAAIEANGDDAGDILECLNRIVHQDSYAAAARAFRREQADFDPARQITAILDRLEGLLAGPGAA